MMSDSTTKIILVLSLACICYLNLLTNRQALYPDIMEARNLITAREMVEKNNWLTPTMNGYPRLAKPPLPTWINGWIGQYYPLSNLAAHRIPPALAAILMIASIFGITRVLTGQFSAAFIAGTIGATAFYLLLMGRQATWDIYCHAFMSASIYFLVLAWYRQQNAGRNHILAGIFMGLSFLSKGPVAHYAMLLPFLVSWTFFIDRNIWKRYKKHLLIFALTGVVIGASWPVYTFMHHSEQFTATLTREVTAWSERHVRPFYQYWGFWGHIGIWTVFTLSTFVYGKMIRRINRRHYLFLLSWTLLTVLLLSIPAEKKERYLLPVLTPMTILTAYYLHHLYQKWKSGDLKKFDKVVININSTIIFLAGTGVLFLLTLNKALGWTDFILFPVVLIVIGFGTIRNLLPLIFLGMVLLMTTVSVSILPRLDKLLYKNEAFESLSILKKQDVYSLPFFGENINPKQIWELGKPVDSLYLQQDKIIPPESPEFIILSRNTLITQNFTRPVSRIELVDIIFYDPEEFDQSFLIYHIWQ